MWRGLRLYLVGCVALVVLAGCGRGFMAFQEREPWRKQAEVECLKSGSVKVTAEKTQVSAINGPGMCGADFPFKVAALGDSALLGYGPEPRPPAGIAEQMPSQMRWMTGPPPARYEETGRAVPGEPMRIDPPSSAPANYSRPISSNPARSAPPPQADEELEDEDDIPDDAERPAPRGRVAPPQTRPAYQPPRAQPQIQPPALGPQQRYSGNIGPAQLTPAATLACPVVAALDQWVAQTVQPAALKWFNQPVVEIKQISAYSCRGMNGNPRANISEHAFGNALDISAFVLADGHRVTVKGGWRGTPEEQAFLHDVQGGACQQFNTVLAPGSNVYHYDHIHVDLMRRSSGRRICQPGAIDGEVVAARAGRNRMARGEPSTTGSIGKKYGHASAVPGEDGIDDE